MSSAGLRVAYLVNQYPKVSHSFIRREICALERCGLEVLRFALRGWNDAPPDPQDRLEQTRTRYVLQHAWRALPYAVVRAACWAPTRFVAAFWLALRMSRRAERGLAYHLIYLAEACRLLNWMREAGTCHLHAHFGTNSAEVAMLAHALGGPRFSFTVHGPEEFDKPLAIGLAEKARRAAFVVVISSFGRGQLYRWLEWRDWRKVHVVHCGLDPVFLEAAASPPPSAPRLLCVGRLCEQKGQLLLLDAARRLAARRIPFELVLAGDGEMRAQIETLIRRYGLATRVRITGWLDGEAVRDEILAARGLVLPSFAEGLPVVVMEAMALQRPVISTYVGGIAELLLPGEHGWLVPAASVEALADAMAALLAAPPETLRRMGEAARQRVVERHAIDREAAKLRALFEEPDRPAVEWREEQLAYGGA